MAWKTYIIGFEIKADNTYQQRYRSLMNEIDKASFKWKEPTSFVSVHVNETLSGLASRLYVNSSISAATDLLVVVDTHTNQAKYYGPESRKPTQYQFNLI